jgi:hypothetical protein
VQRCQRAWKYCVRNRDGGRHGIGPDNNDDDDHSDGSNVSSHNHGGQHMRCFNCGHGPKKESVLFADVDKQPGVAVDWSYASCLRWENVSQIIHDMSVRGFAISENISTSSLGISENNII